MKAGILGSGDVGKALAAGFLKHGHENNFTLVNCRKIKSAFLCAKHFS